MHVVTVHVGQQSVLGADHAQQLRTVGVLRNLDDVALIGHVAVAVLAEGLCLQLIEAFLGEDDLLFELAALGHLLVAYGPVFLARAPLLDERP